jgi:hypothetical protein
MITGTRGTGIMFMDDSNQQLYAFDNATTRTGGIKTDATARTIELLPVTRSSVQFASARDVAWFGAVVVFDGGTPIYTQSGSKSGLWVTVEYPPTMTVTTEG